MSARPAAWPAAPPLRHAPAAAWGAQSPAAPRGGRVLLVGPCPPPHGGISVHVAMASRMLADAGMACRVLDVDAPRGRKERARHAVGPLAGEIRRAAAAGWAVHLHINGHNRGSWLLALACGLAAGPAPLRVLTVHSGMAPAHLAQRRGGWLARLALGLYDRVVCVNPEIRAAVEGRGVAAHRTVLAPAFLGTGERLDAARRGSTRLDAAHRGSERLDSLPSELRAFLAEHAPVLVATSCFRPEYGLDLLIEAMRDLVPGHPQLGCVLLGSGEGEPAVRRSLAAAGIEQRVFLTGDLPHELALELMSRADVFVRPTYADGDSLSVREALALGLPVVASDAAPRPSGVTVCRSGDVGDLVAKLSTVLAQPLAPPPADEPVDIGSLLAAYAPRGAGRVRGGGRR